MNFGDQSLLFLNFYPQSIGIFGLLPLITVQNKKKAFECEVFRSKILTGYISWFINAGFKLSADKVMFLSGKDIFKTLLLVK